MHAPNRNVSNLTTVASRVLYETLNDKSVSEISSIRKKNERTRETSLILPVEYDIYKGRKNNVGKEACEEILRQT